MNVDKALANLCISSEMRRSGDTGRRGAEHRNILQLRFTHQSVKYGLWTTMIALHSAFKKSGERLWTTMIAF